MVSPRHASLMDSISEAASIRQNNRVYELQNRDADIVTLSLGEAFFDLPLPSFEGMRTGALHHYSHSRGVPLLRQKLAKHHEDTCQTQVDPDREIMITTGSKAAIYMALTALLEPGDEVIIPEPLWVSYPEQVRMCRGVPVMVPWHETVADLAGHVTPRTRAIIVNNPHNPTGRRLTEEELRRLHSLAEAHDLVIIADEVYHQFVPAEVDFLSAGAFDPEKRHTVICNSMSKNFGISGWRIGYVIAHEHLMEQITKLQQHVITCAPTILCHYLAENFEMLLAHTRQQREQVVSLRNRMAESFLSLGIDCLPGDSTFYLFPSIGASSLSSTDFAEELLLRHQVSVVAGSGYGASCDRFVRVSVGTEPPDRLLRGIRAIRDLIEETSAEGCGAPADPGRPGPEAAVAAGGLAANRAEEAG